MDCPKSGDMMINDVRLHFVLKAFWWRLAGDSADRDGLPNLLVLCKHNLHTLDM